MFDLNRLLNVLSLRSGSTVDFQRMLDWKLLRGSHEFPGPDGGTCINEAAIVAAGYPYRAVYCVKDLPLCFSRPIALLALCLNDTLDDELRQELLVQFVTRLADSVDTPGIEMARAELMLTRTASEILAPAIARAGFVELAGHCRSSTAAVELVDFARSLPSPDRCRLPQALRSAIEHAADAAAHCRSGLPTDVVFCTYSVMREIASLHGDRLVYRSATAILAAALEIGNRADTGDVEVVGQRLAAAKRSPSAHRDEALVGAP